MSHGGAGVLRVCGSRLLAGGGELRGTARDARRAWSARRGLLLALDVEVVADGGAPRRAVVGLGEASPLPGMSPEHLEEAAAALAPAARAIEGADLPIEGDALDAVARSLDARSVPRSLPPSARLALETALLDAIGVARGASLAALLGARADACVEVSALLGDPGAPGAAARAAALVVDGARTLKLKVGARRLADEVPLVAAVREAVGASVGLLADANGAWSIAEAREGAAALASLGVRLVEQPVAPDQLAALGPLAIATWADESLVDPATRAATLDLPHLDGVVLKPTVLGGLAVARSLARDAAARGRGVAITHALEGPVALAACEALALALAPAAPRAGLWPHAGLAAWPEATPGARHGALVARQGPGLGLDETARAALLALPEVAA